MYLIVVKLMNHNFQCILYDYVIDLMYPIDCKHLNFQFSAKKKQKFVDLLLK